MDHGFQIFLSNRLEVLFDHFKKWLLALRGNPFGTRLIIVPHPQAKNWLQLQLALSPDIGIAAGLQIVTMDRAIKRLAAIYPSKVAGCIPSRLDLAIALYLQLMKSNTDISVKKRRQALALADELASLFASYGLAGPKLTAEWRHGLTSGWQQQLWRELYAQYHPDWCLDSDFAQGMNFSPSSHPPVVAVFGVPYLVPLHQELLMRLSTVAPVSYYLPSPCQHYWSDVLSEREGRRLKRRLNGLPLAQKQTLDGLLQDTNPLLANLGTVGRMMARQLDEIDTELQGAYLLPKAIQDIPAYQELITEETLFDSEKKRLTLLAALQADLVLLRNPAQQQPQELAAYDDSLQVHVAPSHIREVEILYDVLLGIIQHCNEMGNPLTPCDILVMTPDIDAYQASIQAVFGSSHSKLPFRIVDASWSLQCSFLNAFTNLIDLAGSRWDVATVLQVWENPHIQEKHQISAEELERIQKSVEKVGITWGKNLTHRNQILQSSHCRKGMLEDGFIGTWDHGIGLLLESLASGSSTIDYGDADVLGKWLKLFGSLWSDLSLLIEGTHLTLKEWVGYLECLCDSYLQPTDAKSVNDRERLLYQLKELTRASEACPEALFDFASVNFYLKQLLDSPKASQQEGSLQAVPFGSVAGISGLPARVIVLLGLEDGAMPRPKRTQALDLLTVSSLRDHIPSPPQEDRYHFLQAILSARDHLVMSYRGLNPADGKAQGPALVLGELLTYLDRHYRIDGESAAKAVTRQHPHFAFAPAYFMGTSKIQGFVNSNYRASLAYAKVEKCVPELFLPQLFSDRPDVMCERDSTHLLTVRNLCHAAKDPLKLYLQKVLGIYLHEDKLLQTEEPFTLDALNRHSIFSDALESSMEVALEMARQHGRLPLGTFGTVTKRRLEEDLCDIQRVLKEFGTEASELFDVHLSQDCAAPRRVSSKLLHLPPLKITLPNGIEVTVVGRIPNISPVGLVCTTKAEVKHQVRAWPLQLLLSFLAPQLHNAFGMTIPYRTAYLRATGKSVIEGKSVEGWTEFPRFLEYAVQCVQSPSLLIEEWVKDFIQKSPEAILKKINDDIEKSETFHNTYARWLLKEHRGVIEPQMLAPWQKRARELYGPLIEKGGVSTDD